MQTHHPDLPNIPLNLPTVHVVYSPVSVLTVATAKDLIASSDLTTNGARQLFNPAVWPQLEPEIRRIPCSQSKKQCLQDAISYLAEDAVALKSERKLFPALRRLEAKLLIEAILAEETSNA